MTPNPAFILPMVAPKAPAPEPPAPTISPLPPEVERVLESGGAAVVLIRGPSGSGKSAIAARIAERWPSAVVWASTRGMPREARHASREPVSETLVDLSLAGSIRDGTLEQFFVARDALLHWFEAGVPAVVRDSLPKTLAEALPPGEHTKGALLVLDTWDGFVDRYLDLGDGSGSLALRPGRLERQLFGLLRSLDLSLVLVSERGASDAADQFADLVFVTDVAEFEERLVRIVSLPKVRGQPVAEAVYPYTLADGRFSYVPRLTSGEDPLAVGAEPDPNAGDHRAVWPGSAAFHEAFGPLLAGQISIFESDPSVPSWALRLLTGGAALPTLLNGGNILLVVPPDVDLDRVLVGFQLGMGPEEKLASRVRILSATNPGTVDPAFRSVFVSSAGPSGTDLGFIAVRDERSPSMLPLFPETTQFLRSPSRSGAANLGIVTLDGLAAAALSFGRSYSAEMLPGLLKQDVNGAPAHLMVSARSDDPLLAPLRAIGSPYLRILERQGRVFVLGVRPWTPAYVLLPASRPEDGRPYDLIRMS